MILTLDQDAVYNHYLHQIQNIIQFFLMKDEEKVQKEIENIVKEKIKMMKK